MRVFVLPIRYAEHGRRLFPRWETVWGQQTPDFYLRTRQRHMLDQLHRHGVASDQATQQVADLLEELAWREGR